MNYPYKDFRAYIKANGFKYGFISSGQSMGKGIFFPDLTDNRRKRTM